MLYTLRFLWRPWKAKLFKCGQRLVGGVGSAQTHRETEGLDRSESSARVKSKSRQEASCGSSRGSRRGWRGKEDSGVPEAKMEADPADGQVRAHAQPFSPP